MEKENQIGLIVMVFITVIVGVLLFQVVSQEVGTATSTDAVVNETLTSTASSVNNLLGQAVDGSVTVVNATGGGIILSTLYTVADNQIVDGDLTATFTVNATGEDVGEVWHLSYTYEPDGYLSGASGSLALLIPIFFALAILLVAMIPTFRNEILRMMGK